MVIEKAIVLCKPTELYNILNQNFRHPYISDPNYLLLLDARQWEEFERSHIITARLAPRNPGGNFTVPSRAELDCKKNLIIYDGTSCEIVDKSPAMALAQKMVGKRCSRPISILEGGLELFASIYPFLLTQKIIYMPRELEAMETYPLEIVRAELYLGTCNHLKRELCNPLKIQAILNCSTTPVSDETWKVYNVDVPEDDTCYVSLAFQGIVKFLDDCTNAGMRVLICSDLGIGRNTVFAMAYLIHYKQWSLKKAYDHVKSCCLNMRPRLRMIEQLAELELEVLGTQTSLEDLGLLPVPRAKKAEILREILTKVSDETNKMSEPNGKHSPSSRRTSLKQIQNVLESEGRLHELKSEEAVDISLETWEELYDELDKLKEQYESDEPASDVADDLDSAAFMPHEILRQSPGQTSQSPKSEEDTALQDTNVNLKKPSQASTVPSSHSGKPEINVDHELGTRAGEETFVSPEVLMDDERPQSYSPMPC